MSVARDVKNNLEVDDPSGLPRAFHKVIIAFKDLMTKCFEKRGVRACLYDSKLDAVNEVGYSLAYGNFSLKLVNRTFHFIHKSGVFNEPFHYTTLYL